MNRPAIQPRRRMMVVLGVAAPAALLAGCGFGNAPRLDFHLLRDADANAPATPGPVLDRVLLVSSGAMPGLYDSDRMVFSANGRSRSYFQFGYWSERPAQTLLLLSEARLIDSRRFREVASSTSGVRGDLLLSLRLDELYLDASTEPGRVKLIVMAELIDWRSRQLLARRSFAQAAPVPKRDAGGLAEAASQAVGVMLGELVAWTAASAA
ncbi:MAG: putative lipoprotein [Proteobacteria bacterium]|jgi:cholesterol transport system auxiliary component|nr:putative lipoprotein [Pseudomonadota bacterium]